MNIKYEFIFLLKRIYWFIFRPRTKGVKCILENNGKILMIRRTYGTDKWVFPGGAIKANETIENAVRREIQEDLDITLDQLRSLGSFTQTIHHRQETLHCFAGTISSNSLRLDKEKIQEVRWFDISELPELTPVSNSVISLYKKG